MLSWIVTQSLKQRALVIVCAIVLVGLGIRATQDVPLDVFPEFAPPMVEVQTEAPGLSTEEVENLVTIPLEAGVNGVPGLKTLRSKSVLGLSSGVLMFTEGSDVIRARQLVQERVATVAPSMKGMAASPDISPEPNVNRPVVA